MKSIHAFLFAAFLIAGCGESMPPTADPAIARSTLEAALGAWRKSDSPQSLKSQTPAIYFNDPEFQAGKTLVDYKIESEQAAGVSWRCEVLLTVKDKGAPEQRPATYCIDTEPALVVVREP